MKFEYNEPVDISDKTASIQLKGATILFGWPIVQPHPEYPGIFKVLPLMRFTEDNINLLADSAVTIPLWIAAGKFPAE